jgi:hypothetical protein
MHQAKNQQLAQQLDIKKEENNKLRQDIKNL